MNRIIEKFEQNRFHFHKTTPLSGEVEIEVYGEASFERDETNQQGLAVVIRKIGSKRANLLSWKSNTADRMVWSTVAAQQALDRTVHIKEMLNDMGCKIKKVTTLTDNLSLRRVVYSGKTTKELRLRREEAAARDLLVFDQIRVRYVPTEKMLADPMTKSMKATELFQLGRMNNLDTIDEIDKDTVSASEMLEAEIQTPMLELSKRLQMIQEQYRRYHEHMQLKKTRRVRKHTTKAAVTGPIGKP